MLRISLPFIYKLHAQIGGLARLPTDRDAPAHEFFVEFLTAQWAIQELTQNSVYAAYLRASYSLAGELLQLLSEVTASSAQQPAPDIGRWTLWGIKNKFDQYEITLLSELGTLQSFFVTQKGAYDVTTLLNWGENLFPLDLSAKVSEASFDAREAAKCIAYEVPTAAAFHTFRVVESVLRRYYSQMTGGAAPPKVRSIKIYVRALAEVGDPKILACLVQMADLHRNPLIHPEAAITLDEAISMVGIGRSAVTAMLAALPIPAPTTATVGALAPPNPS